jgi:S-adenosylmethionine synthetase
MTNSFIFTSESVGEGHPDKVCDRVSDAILDNYLALDAMSRVACETLVKNEVVIVAGEITSAGEIDFDSIVRQAVRDIGYTDPHIGFDAETCKVMSFLSQQSQDIKVGVDEGAGLYKEQGAGDQGLMFGFACDETPELMPLPISLSHQLMLKLSQMRKSDSNTFLRPDAKAQVSVEYHDNAPKRVDTVVISTQHTEAVSLETVQEYVREELVKKVIPARLLDEKTRYFINPTGRFVIGGPVGDCGLTGRKIIVDTYGGYARHGGGAFSGKDPTKVDRSAAYAARYIAKNVVAAGLAKKCEVQVAYAIGVAEPVSVYVNTFGTSTVDEQKISRAVSKTFSLTPRGIIESLALRKPIYQATAAYGHFGREPGKDGSFSWEKVDMVDALKAAL